MAYKVSFLMMCYRQERFVRESVRSVLSQDMVGIEIIISDDCSPDRTYDILQEECGRYTGKNHVIVRRTKKNLGINLHMNELVDMAKGRLIVLGAGDDIARKDKASVIYRQWCNTNALVFGCCPKIIDERGKIIGDFYSTGMPNDFSCKAIIKRKNAGIFISGFDRKVFDAFGPLEEKAMEDQIIPFRAALMQDHGVSIIAEPLVLYRAHPESQVMNIKFAKKQDPLEILKNKIITNIQLYRGWLFDMRAIKSRGVYYLEDEKNLSDRIVFFEIINEIANERALKCRLLIVKNGIESKKIPIEYLLQAFFFAIAPACSAYLLSWFVRNFIYVNRYERGI